MNNRMSGKGKAALRLMSFMILALPLGACQALEAPMTAAFAFDQSMQQSPGKQPAELSYYYVAYDVPRDLGIVEAAINEYIQPLIDARVKLHPILESGYKNTIDSMLASNEEFDILWTSDRGSGDFDYKIANGGLLRLDDRLAETPALVEAVPSYFWEDAKVGDSLYAVPNVQNAAKSEGFAIQKRLIDEYGIDVGKIKKPTDIEPVLRLIREEEPGMIPIASTAKMFGYGREYGYSPLGYKLGDPYYRIVDARDTAEYANYLERMRKWYESGYIYEDSALLNEEMLVSLLRTGKVAVEWSTELRQGDESEGKERFGGNEVVYVPLSEPVFAGARASMTAISRTSENPEQALRFIELLNTDAYLFNMLAYGIEGEHYRKIGDDTIDIRRDGGYSSDIGWVFGNVLNGYAKEGQAADYRERTERLNETAARPETAGFRFDSSAYMAEAARLDAVDRQYAAALNSGAIDPAKFLPQYRDAYRQAGEEKVRQIKQKQLDEWLKVNGKK